MESPPEFSYDSSYQVFSGIALSRITAQNVKYNPNQFTVSPSFYAGMYLNPVNGGITGTSIFETDHIRTYTIMAKNSASNVWVSRQIDFIYQIAYCPKDEKWPRSPLDYTAYVPCQTDYVGDISRKCYNVEPSVNGYDGIWDSPNTGMCKPFSEVAIGLKEATVTRFALEFSDVNIEEVTSEDTNIIKRALTSTILSILPIYDDFTSESIILTYLYEKTASAGTKLSVKVAITTPTLENSKDTLLFVINTNDDEFKNSFNRYFIEYTMNDDKWRGKSAIISRAFLIEYVPPPKKLGLGGIIGIIAAVLVVLCVLIYSCVHMMTRQKVRRHDHISGNRSMRLGAGVGAGATGSSRMGSRGSFRASVRRGAPRAR